MVDIPVSKEMLTSETGARRSAEMASDMAMPGTTSPTQTSVMTATKGLEMAATPLAG
jgi:hypothetical protein